MLFTEPITTSLYLTCVLPGSRPSALLKLMVTAGPRSVIDFTTSAMPMSAAISGTTQTREGSQPRRGSTPGSGASGRSGGVAGPCGLFMRRLRNGAGHRRAAAFEVVPDQSRVELHRRQHCQDHYATERERAGPGGDDGKRFEAHECNGQR